MNSEAVTEEQMLTRVHAIPGFENLHPGVAPLVYKLYVDKKVKKTGLVKAQVLVKNIIAELWCFNAELHLFNDNPYAAHVSGFDEVGAVVDLIKERIGSGDTHKFNKNANPPIEFPQAQIVQVDTIQGVKDMATAVGDAQKSSAPQTLYLDCEGKDLGREGKICVVQILLPCTNTVYIVLAHLLGEELWTTSADHAVLPTLKHILESTSIMKAFWGISSDSEALFFRHGIRLDATSVIDLQLYDLAGYEKGRDRKYVKSVDLAVEKYLNFPWADKARWLTTKRHEKRMMKEGINYAEVITWQVDMADSLLAQLRGDDERRAAAKEDYELLQAQGCPVLNNVNVWQEFPLRPEMLEYAVGDVLLLPLLHRHYTQSSKLTEARLSAIKEETCRRIIGSQDAMAKNPGHDGPPGWNEQTWCKENTTISDLSETSPNAEGEGMKS